MTTIEEIKAARYRLAALFPNQSVSVSFQCCNEPFNIGNEFSIRLGNTFECGPSLESVEAKAIAAAKFEQVKAETSWRERADKEAAARELKLVPINQ